MTCGLAEEETRLVTSRGRNNSARQRLVMCQSFCVLTCICERRIYVALSCLWIAEAPDQGPPADRLRAVLSVGTNRAPCQG